MFDLISCQARIRHNVRPLRGVGFRDHALVPFGFLPDEVLVHCVVIELGFDEAFHQGCIATNTNRQVHIGKFCGLQSAFHVLLGVLEASEPGLWEWIDVDNSCTCVFRISKCRQHTGMVCTGVLSNDHDHIGVVKVVQRDGSFADAYGWLKAFST